MTCEGPQAVNKGFDTKNFLLGAILSRDYLLSQKKVDIWIE